MACTQKNHTEQHKHTKSTKTQKTFRKKPIFCVFRIFIFLFLISQMISPRNVELPPWYGQWHIEGLNNN